MTSNDCVQCSMAQGFMSYLKRLVFRWLTLQYPLNNIVAREVLLLLRCTVCSPRLFCVFCSLVEHTEAGSVSHSYFLAVAPCSVCCSVITAQGVPELLFFVFCIYLTLPEL